MGWICGLAGSPVKLGKRFYLTEAKSQAGPVQADIPPAVMAMVANKVLRYFEWVMPAEIVNNGMIWVNHSQDGW
ncbi:MAG: hypothetical protein QJR05_10460 [Thermoanaerobacterium sp.]|nr:hypothetical protein [Thermoanaerobacterium sp.]